jgi:seryl-tRNA synthetase
MENERIVNMQKEINKFRWETEEEFLFREKVRNFSFEMKKILAELNDADPNYKELKDKITNIKIEIENMSPPQIYSSQYNNYFKSLEYYHKAFVLLNDSLLKKGVIKEGKTHENVFKAAKYIEAGTAYTVIISVENFDLWDHKNKECISKNPKKGGFNN